MFYVVLLDGMRKDALVYIYYYTTYKEIISKKILKNISLSELVSKVNPLEGR